MRPVSLGSGAAAALARALGVNRFQSWQKLEPKQPTEASMVEGVIHHCTEMEVDRQYGLNCGLGFKKPRKSMNLWLPLTKVSKQPRRAEFSVLRKSKCKCSRGLRSNSD